MSVAILIITHDTLGDAVLHTATETFGPPPLVIDTLAVPRDGDPDGLRRSAREMADMFGSTPGNVACSLLTRSAVRVVSGLNLPMLLKLFNYADLDLMEISAKAMNGGRSGVVEVPSRGGDEDAD